MRKGRKETSERWGKQTGLKREVVLHCRSTEGGCP